MENVQCDVLVLGGGLAGCWAALKAKELVPHVVLVDKGKVSRSGKSSFAGAGILCPLSSDNLDLWHKEIVESGQYINDQDWVRVLLQELEEKIKDLQKFGVQFGKDEKGNLLRSAALGGYYTKVAHVDSLKLMGIMRRRLEDAGVKILDRVMVTSLLTSDGFFPTRGSVVGAFGFHTRTSETFVFNAKSTVVTNGSTGHFDLSGDGIAHSFLAGAEVSNMEFARTFDEMGFEDRYLGLHLITFQRLGMILLNSKGERFMERYQPLLKEKVKRQELALAVMSEGLQGRGPIYIDLTHIDKASYEELRTMPTTSGRVRTLERDGIDLSKQKVRFTVGSGFVNIERGGIRNNIYGECSLAGLFTAGEAGGFPMDGAGSVPLKLGACCVSGYRAGEYAARYARDQEQHLPAMEQIEQIKEQSLRPFSRRDGLRPEALFHEIEGFLSPANHSVFRNSRNIKLILEQVEVWKEKARSLTAGDLHELVRANKVKSHILCIELVFSSSLVREETRSNNIRTDFPYRDDLNWLRRVILRKDGSGEICVNTVPLPMYRYPVKPDKYAKIPVSFPLSGRNGNPSEADHEV